MYRKINFTGQGEKFAHVSTILLPQVQGWDRLQKGGKHKYMEAQKSHLTLEATYLQKTVKSLFCHPVFVHSCQQKSIGLKFSKSQTGSDVWYSCHHNLSRFTFPIFAHSCHFSVLHSLQSITPRVY